MTDFHRPGPVNMFVLLDESKSLNAGWFLASLGGFDPRNPALHVASEFGDAPSVGHAEAGGFLFADGHSEIHKWRQYDLTVAPSAEDVDWLQSKTTALKVMWSRMDRPFHPILLSPLQAELEALIFRQVIMTITPLRYMDSSRVRG